MNLKKVADAFFNSFHSNHVILYIGQNANDDELKEYISKCLWSCIITSRRDPELASFFANDDRVPKEYSLRSEIPAKPLHRTKMPILRLFGVEGEKNEDEDLSWLCTDFGEQEDSGYDMYRAQEMLGLLPDLLDHVNPLVIIGATSDIDWKLFGKYLTPLLYKDISDGSVSIWNMPKDTAPEYADAFCKLAKVAQLKKFDTYECSLSEAIRSYGDEFSQYSGEISPLPEYDNDIYYQGNLPVSISLNDLLLFKNVGTLLTERTIYRIRPLGRILSRKYFSNFLEHSSILGPQWYGYLPQSTFYVKRSYEDALVQLVRKMLDGRGVTDNSITNRPIILTGDPGSSKSITLGALAYRIYNERLNPVIYISKDSFLSANIGTNFDALDEAMQLLERKSVADTRILIIWDSSAYRTGVEQAKMLLKRLQNRGRRFVLVCSSYSMLDRRADDQDACYRLSDNGSGKFELCTPETAQVFDRSEFYFVQAIREMNDHEQFEFWKRVKEYSGINDATISQFKKQLADENRNEVFDFYYLLITVLRDNLEQGLKSEQSKIAPYVKKEIHKAIGNINSESMQNKQSSSMYQAFLSAGLDPSFFMDEAENPVPIQDEDDDQELNKKLDMFNTCVALFSRFKLSVPYGLVYTLLLGDTYANQYSEGSQHLYKIVTTEIPWIHYGEDENGDFSFRFRNPLEADIFLRNHDITGEQQVELVCKIIDIYGADYRRSKCKDLSFTDNLQALLRLMGPNSDYTPFLKPSRKYEHSSILEKLDHLIDKVKDLREVYGVPDEDAGFAAIIVTFTREYYGTIWNTVYSSTSSANYTLARWEDNPDAFSVENYEFRIEQLISAIALAERSIEGIERRICGQEMSRAERLHLTNQRYSMAVEIAQCNMRLEDLIEEYQSCCGAFGVRPKQDLISRKLRYQVLYQQLSPVISSTPTNGYAYNALFKAFRKMYEKENLSDAKKLQYLSEIMQIVETCETLDDEIVNRGSHGSDELTDHINRIKDFSTGLQITLESICRHRKGLPAKNENEQLCFELFDEMLKANNAAAITFICQKELRIPKGTRQLNSDQLLRCRTVYNFMKEDDNFECICTNAYALAMLIRVCWMLYNETTLTNSPECQMTKLNHKQWLELNRLCSMYAEIAGDNKQPLIILIYALSALQVSNLAEYGYQEALDILNSITEDMFFQRRMWTPFMLCDETGSPYKFSGKVLSTKDNSGFIRVYGVPQRMNKDVGVRFHHYNLGRTAKMPELMGVLNDLELGIGYTGFSIYTQAGRKEREAKT